MIRRPLIYSGKNPDKVARVIELYRGRAMEFRSPMYLYPQTLPTGSRASRDHYWRRSFPFSSPTGLFGKYACHAGEDFSLYGFGDYIHGNDPSFVPRVYAPCQMKIITAKYGRNGGNYINAFLVTPEVKENVYGWFFHLGTLLVEPGDTVRAGAPISEMVMPTKGWGRWARGAHLHFHVAMGENSTAYGINWPLFENVGKGLMAEEQHNWAESVIAYVEEYGENKAFYKIPKEIKKRWLNLKPYKRTEYIKQFGY